MDEKVIEWAETGGSHYVERRIKWSSDEEEPIPGATNFGQFDVLDRTVSIFELEPINVDDLLAEMADQGATRWPGRSVGEDAD